MLHADVSQQSKVPLVGCRSVGPNGCLRENKSMNRELTDELHQQDHAIQLQEGEFLFRVRVDL